MIESGKARLEKKERKNLGKSKAKDTGSRVKLQIYTIYTWYTGV